MQVEDLHYKNLGFHRGRNASGWRPGMEPYILKGDQRINPIHYTALGTALKETRITESRYTPQPFWRGPTENATMPVARGLRTTIYYGH